MLNNKINITVLICVHSPSELYDNLLIEAMNSLSQQTYKQFKVLLVLDECWPNTKTLIKSKKYDFEIKIVEKPIKQGLAIAKNFGLSFVDTEWVAYLDCDDYYLPEKLQKQIEYVQRNDVDFLATNFFYLDDEKTDGEKIFNPDWQNEIYQTHEEILENIEKVNFLAHGTMLIRTKVIKYIGGYNDVKGEEDWDLWKRAIKLYKFAQIPDRLYVHRLNTSVPR